MLLRIAALSAFRAERILYGTLGLYRLAGTDCGKVIQQRFGQFRLYRCEAGMDTPGASSPLFIFFFNSLRNEDHHDVESTRTCREGSGAARAP